MLADLMITPVYAGLLGIGMVYLSYRVVRFRIKYQVGVGDGGHKELTRAIRVHGNFTEYVPLSLILLLITEIEGFSPIILHIIGVLLISGRLLHAKGLRKSSGVSLERKVGMLLTWVAAGAAAILSIVGAFGMTI